MCLQTCPAGFACDGFGVCTGGNLNAIVLDEKSITVAGVVTLNGAVPVSNSPKCEVFPSGNTYQSRATVYLVETTHGYTFELDLQGCQATAATFSGIIYPGTYRITVRGNY